MAFFEHDGLRFRYQTLGRGIPVVWQHGLGSDVEQTFALLTQHPGIRPKGFRFLGFDARGHGETRPLGDPKKIAIATFADDLARFLDNRKMDRAVVGGISMGAAVALNFALRFPDRVVGLVLSRPAWLDRPLPENLRVFTHVAQAILKHGAREGGRLFRQTPEFQLLLGESPDCAQAIFNHFESPRAEECVARLERIPHDTPCRDRSEWAMIDVPTLVLANRQDPIHPFDYAEVLARTIPRAELREITPKSVSLERHAEDVQRALSDFLSRHFSDESHR